MVTNKRVSTRPASCRPPRPFPRRLSPPAPRRHAYRSASRHSGRRPRPARPGAARPAKIASNSVRTAPPAAARRLVAIRSRRTPIGRSRGEFLLEHHHGCPRFQKLWLAPRRGRLPIAWCWLHLGCRALPVIAATRRLPNRSRRWPAPISNRAMPAPAVALNLLAVTNHVGQRHRPPLQCLFGRRR